MHLIRKLLTGVSLLCATVTASGWPGMPMPRLHVEGRYLKDSDGNVVNLHGFAQTYSPWFNEQNTKWGNYDVDACLRYNKEKIDQLLAAGWKMSFIRLHMDPYWSNTPGVKTEGEHDISAFDFSRFTRYLDEVFIPMAEYAVSKGLYVVMRPPGVCPSRIAVGDDYHKYLKKVWGHVSSHSRLTGNPHIMFELANEPIEIKGTDGNYTSWSDGSFKNLSQFFQEIVDIMRGNGCDNILWIPGTGYQSQYAGFAKYPVKGDNIGYAVHVYPGWYGSDAMEPSQELGGSYGGGFEAFSAGWDAQVGPVADFAPIMVTEMDWAPSKYNASWGKSITGKMFGDGFGGNFKIIADNCGNVSWLLFTGCEHLAKFTGTQGSAGGYTFLNDPEACPWPVYHWYKDYAGESLGSAPTSMELSLPSDGDCYLIATGSSLVPAMVADYAGGFQLNAVTYFDITTDNPDIVSYEHGRITGNAIGSTHATISYTLNGTTHSDGMTLNCEAFPMHARYINPSIWEKGSFDQSTHTFVTGQYGFAGWKYPNGIDLSAHKYLIAELDGANTCGVSFRLFDKNDYWSQPATVDFGNNRLAVFDLSALRDGNGQSLDPSHIYIAGFWSYGNQPFKIARVYLSDRPDGPSGIGEITSDTGSQLVDVYNMQGMKVKSQAPLSHAGEGLRPGIYIAGGKKIIVTGH